MCGVDTVSVYKIYLKRKLHIKDFGETCKSHKREWIIYGMIFWSKQKSQNHMWFIIWIVDSFIL